MSALAAPSPRSWRRVALVGIGALVSGLLIAIGALMLLVLVARHSVKTSLRFAGVRTLVVQSHAGDVSLRAAPAGAPVLVTEDQTESLFRPKVRSRLAAGGRLTLSASCAGSLSCGVHYELSVPPRVAVDVSSGFGDINATGLASTESIELDTTAGDIHASGLSAPDVRLSTGVGSLTATLSQPAKRLDAGTGAGSLNLTVPDTSYALQAHTSLGHVSDQSVRVDPSAPRSIDAHSSLGDITITVAP